jgi:hypothetical protein
VREREEYNKKYNRCKAGKTYIVYIIYMSIKDDNKCDSEQTNATRYNFVCVCGGRATFTDTY